MTWSDCWPTLLWLVKAQVNCTEEDEPCDSLLSAREMSRYGQCFVRNQTKLFSVAQEFFTAKLRACDVCQSETPKTMLG